MKQLSSACHHLAQNLSPQNLLGQIWRYGIAGGLAFLVDFGLFAFCLYILKWHYLIANIFGLAGGLVVNYLASVSWVFRACKRNVEKKSLEFSLFVVIGILGVAFNQFLMWAFVDFLSLMPMFAKFLAAVLVLFWNFGARKFFLFRSLKD